MVDYGSEILRSEDADVVSQGAVAELSSYSAVSGHTFDIWWILQF